MLGGPLFGGEFFLSPAFSVGLEAGLGVDYSRSWSSSAPDDGLSSESTGVGPFGNLVFRLYP